MEDAQVIVHNYEKRLHYILNESWKIFKSQYIFGRHDILREAPFQHHFGNIISTVGNLYCVGRNDLFSVDLETKCKNVKNKNKYIDITCSFINEDIRCAIELKFKTKQQGAQDHGRIDCYADIESLELVTQTDYTFGKFYMITDSTAYIKPSSKGVGTVFAMHDGNISEPGKEFWYHSKGREHVKIILKKSYSFRWEKINNWYFLDLTI